VRLRIWGLEEVQTGWDGDGNWGAVTSEGAAQRLCRVAGSGGLLVSGLASKTELYGRGRKYQKQESNIENPAYLNSEVRGKISDLLE